MCLLLLSFAPSFSSSFSGLFPGLSTKKTAAEATGEGERKGRWEKNAGWQITPGIPNPKPPIQLLFFVKINPLD